jgi:hypothetical protein
VTSPLSSRVRVRRQRRSGWWAALIRRGIQWGSRAKPCDTMAMASDTKPPTTTRIAMSAPARTAEPMGSSGVGFMGDRMGSPAYLRNRAHVASADYRLADRWGCQIGTAKSRRERCVREMLDVVEVYLGLGDTQALGHILSLLDAALAGHPELPKLDAIYYANKADVAEDEAEIEYRRNPSPKTAKAWLDAMGHEARANPIAMAYLRAEHGL